MIRMLVAAALIALPGPLAAQSRDTVNDALDLFALDLFDRIQPVSIREGREYCGYLGFDAAGRMATTEPRRGLPDYCDPGSTPPGFDVVASWHTHGAWTWDADVEAPSIEDLLADFDEGIDGYIATPGGRVWLNLVDERRSILLCGRGCVVSDPAFRPCPAFLPGTEYTIPSLRARTRRDTGHC